jgi:hypothetical protein
MLDNALVVHVVGPRTRIFSPLTDDVPDLIPVRVDGVGRDVADTPSGRAHDVGQIGRQRCPRDDAAGEEHLVAPDAHFHLAVGSRIDLVALGDDGVGDLVAELVRVSGENDFAHADHDGHLESWV